MGNRTNARRIFPGALNSERRPLLAPNNRCNCARIDRANSVSCPKRSGKQAPNPPPHKKSSKPQKILRKFTLELELLGVDEEVAVQLLSLLHALVCIALWLPLLRHDSTQPGYSYRRRSLLLLICPLS